METEGGGREESQHHELRSTHPYPQQEVDAPNMKTGLRSKGMEKFFHSYFDDDVSLHGEILSREPLDQQRRMDASPVEASLIDFRGVGALGELDTTLGVLGRPREERHNSLEELLQPPLFSLRMRGESSMSHSLCMSRTYGKGVDCLHDYLYDICIYPLTIYM